MRFVCRACRQEVDEKSESCGKCGAVLDSRSRISLSEVGLDVVDPPLEDSDEATQPDRATEVVDDSRLSAGIISGSNKSADGGPESRSGAAAKAAQKRKRPRKSARRTRRPGRPYSGVTPDAPSKVDDLPDPVPPPTLTKPVSGRGGSGPPPLSGAPNLSPHGAGSGGSPPGKPQTRGTPCPSCGTPNDPGNHFCDSCHQPMKAATTVQLTEQQVGRDPWYRRALGTTRFRGADNRLWGQRLRDRDLGSGLRHSGGMAARSRLKLAAAALAIVAIAALLLGPLRSPIAELFSPPADPIRFTVRLGGDAPEMSADSLDRLSDGSIQVALQMPWQTILPPHACGDRRAYTIRLDFAEGEEPKELRVHISKDPVDDGETSELWPGPSLLSIQGETDCSGPLEVSTDAGWVSYDVGTLAASGTWIELYVHERREDSAVNTNNVMVIGEIELLE